MKPGIALLISGTAVVCMALASCGGSGTSAPPAAPPAPPPAPPAAPPPVTMDLDTAAVLAIVQTRTSDTAEPFQLDNGAVEVIPVGDETSAPISLDGT
jgi:multidrug efflux pump subunit AcrA (membrane-fusion protein)